MAEPYIELAKIKQELKDIKKELKDIKKLEKARHRSLGFFRIRFK